MRKLDIDLAAAADSNVSSNALDQAHRIMQRHQGILRTPGVVGTWVGAAASRPYIMVAVDQNTEEDLTKTIPDSIEGVAIYYIQGSPAL
jgi:hypothetical protein